MIAFEVYIQSKLMTFRELLVYFSRIKARLYCPPKRLFFFYLQHCRASPQPVTRVEFKLVARQVVASVVIRAAKPKFVAESRTGSRLLCATCCLNLQHCTLLRDVLVTNMAIRATMCFNLQCNNVARQIEVKCCPYYWTFNSENASNV